MGYGPRHSAAQLWDTSTDYIEAGLGRAARLIVDRKFSDLISDPTLPRVHASPASTALILAGGAGTRMRPLTETTPKPLVKMMDKPLVDYTLDLMEQAGVNHFRVNTHYLSEQVRDHISARENSVWRSHGSKYTEIKQSDIDKLSQST